MPPRSELAWIDRLRRLASSTTAARAPGLVLGIGDDCAIFRPRPGEDLVFTTDLMLEGVHFRASYPPAAVGHRTLARGLSDIAAMGAGPRFCLVSLAVAATTPERWIEGFYRGLLELAARTGTALAGGDLARGDRLTADILVCGWVPRNRALRRDGARPGDVICVSGTLGGAALGLERGRGAAWKRHLMPEPRLELGRRLRGRATACLDLSDGLALDLHRLALASNVAADLRRPLPIFRGASEPQALHGGEDYELLFTLPPRARVPRDATAIGVIRPGPPGALTLDGQPLGPLGYDHFLRA